jgi:hypothetical protein
MHNLFLLQFRRGQWRKSRKKSPGRRCVPICRFGSPEPATETGVLFVSLGLRFRDVAEVDVSKLVHRQREVSGISIALVCDSCCCVTTDVTPTEHCYFIAANSRGCNGHCLVNIHDTSGYVSSRLVRFVRDSSQATWMHNIHNIYSELFTT